MTRKLCAALACAAAAFAIAGCSSQDEPLFDPEQADEIVEAAMLEVEDLPGEGWVTVTSDDDDDDFDIFGFDSDACSELADRAEGLEAKFPGLDDESTEEVANATAEFERPSDTVAASVEADIGVYESNSDAADTIAAFRELMGDEIFGECMADAVADELDTEAVEGFTMEYSFEEVPAIGRVPGEDGVAKGFDFTVTASGFGATIELSLNMNMYFWNLGNGVVYAFVATSDGDLNNREVEGIVTTLNAKLRDQATR